MSLSKQLSIRMPVDLVKRLESHGAAAPYVIEAVREKLDKDDEARIEASLACLANDVEANDISDWGPMQQEVMKRGH